ncbi:MAG: hypothetical protein EOO10_09225, partial [Chitinophagaceae bacterium]
METLAEQLFFGIWRSYKTFKRLGNICLDTETSFQEFTFSTDRMLTIKFYEKGSIRTIVATDQWVISLQKGRHFLAIVAPKMNFEVITVNHTVLVLVDTISSEKTFFARNHHWVEYIKSNKSIV